MLTVPGWEIATFALLATLYAFLSLFRAAQVELSRLELSGVLEAATREGGPLARWSAPGPRARLLLAIQISFQAILILAGALATDMTARAFPAMGAGPRLAIAFGTTAMLLVVLLRSFLVRLTAKAAPERALLLSAPVATVTAAMLEPILLLLDAATSRLLARLRHEPGEKTEESLEREVSAFVSMGREEGILEKEEGDLVRNVVDSGDTIVREVMTPRTDMVVLERSARLGEVRRAFVAAKHSRLPVQHGSADHIEGVLNIKDLLPVWSEPSDTPVEDRIRPVMFVPETKRVLDLLREMQKARAHFAVVVDEYGGTAGLVTIEDLVEEIVGDIQDEHESGESDIVEEGPGTWRVSGLADIEEVADLLRVEVEAADFDTVGGLVNSLLGRVPGPGESLDWEGIHIDVLEADGRRVHRVRMRRAGVPASAEGKKA